jgi:formylglycine-generating enzyme required for sulfatase activity
VAKDRLAKRKANAAVILLRMGQADKVWPLFKHSEDSRTRSYLIHRLASLGTDPQLLLNRLEQETEVSNQRALVLCLGEFDEEAIPLDKRDELKSRFQKLFTDALDAGLHSAAEWILKQWKDEDFLKTETEKWTSSKPLREQRLDIIRQQLSEGNPDSFPNWYTNSQGQTMSVVRGPSIVSMGSPETEFGREDDEILHRIRIDRSFAIATTPVTVAQYQHFAPEYEPNPNVVSSGDCPAVGMDWYRAAEYCNRLSQEEGIPELECCYVISRNEKKEISAVRIRENYLHLEGYRLPTEAEMEFATRAGSVTSRFYGESDELLPKYAVFYSKNSQRRMQPVGRLKPNDLGIFDAHGNANTWCHDLFKDYPHDADGENLDVEETVLEIVQKEARVFRGGSFKDDASLVRSAYRNTMPPEQTYNYLGFRVARTLRPAQPDRPDRQDQ